MKAKLFNLRAQGRRELPFVTVPASEQFSPVDSPRAAGSGVEMSKKSTRQPLPGFFK